MNPSTTFTELSHPPDFGISLSIDGKSENSENGMARAKAKPNIPTAGPVMLPMVAASTSNVPMIGPVHENDTSVRVNAMKNMLRNPVVLPARLSIWFDHDDGNVMSNAPKNEMANTTSIRKKNTLNTALVDSSLRALAPNARVIINPSNR